MRIPHATTERTFGELEGNMHQYINQILNGDSIEILNLLKNYS